MSYKKYYLYKQQVSYDGGSTWENTGNYEPSGNSIAEYSTLEECQGSSPTCTCSMFSVNANITVPNSGGTVALGTFTNSCLGDFSYSTTTPSGMVTSGTVSGGTNVSAYTVTISENQDTTTKTGTITVSYTAGENSCTTSAISISQAAADVPKVILTLTGGTSVSKNCDGNPLTYTDTSQLINSDFSKIKEADIKSCVTTIGELNGAGTFNDAVNMTRVTLPDTLTTIYNRTFWGCTGLTSITLPNSLTYLGNDALRYCTSLTTLNIPDSVQTIGGLCFFGNTNLTTVVIGTGFTTVLGPGQCFNGCVNLQSVTVKATTPPNIDSMLFYNTNNSFIIYVPAASVNAYKSAPGWSDYASRIQAIT